MRCVLIQLEYQEDEKMTITVAGNKKEYEDGINLPTLIEKEQIDNAEYVTVTINDEFVEREKFPETIIKDGDVVEFLYFMGG
ncbi:MAG TPA: thiamine biosynthesis protein ThiS, partial [Lachnospiraceae bacterium]|nr:thiamine biosynthesis protein ThiS [Lachnospiraceae bacterium]